MGYYTSHELAVIDGDNGLISELRSECEAANYALDGNGECHEACKWYDHEEDMRAFSAKHPAALFGLSGEGEESGDLWKEYYKGGKMHRCKAVISYPDFNIRQLT